MRITALFLSLIACMTALAASVAPAEEVDVAALVAKIRAVGPKGQGHQEAIAAWQQLAKADAEQLPQVLTGIDGAGKLATNWLRAAAESIAARQTKAGGKLPTAELERFIQQTDHAPRGRRLAYEILAAVDPTAQDRLIPGMLNDRSLELRRDAIALALDKAAKLAESNKQQAAAAYRTALTAARDLDQIKSASESLRELGQQVDLPTHFGFVMRWKLIGPFDNTNKRGFDVAYPPEEEVNLKADYAGKEGRVKWFDYTTDDEYGIVDLNKAIAKHMGAVGYAYAEFVSDAARDAEIRLGCINGNQVWLNGKLIMANHVYHANTEIDQYIGSGKLTKGKNTILVKVCQNEQTEAWAQRWQFQLRVCDQYGTAILSQDRPLNQTAALDRPRR